MSDSADYKRAKKQRVATEGECSRCRAPAVRGKSMCQYHLADQNAYSLQLFHRKRGRRQCTVCDVWGHNRTSCPVRALLLQQGQPDPRPVRKRRDRERRKLSIAATASQGEGR